MKLHHIAYLTGDISKTAQHFCKSCGYEIVSKAVEDKIQTAYVQFLRLPRDGTMLELVSPNSEKSKLSKALKKGVKLHHLCYETSDMETDLRNFSENGFLILCEPVEACAIGNRKIAWVMDADKNLFELIDTLRNDSDSKK